MGVVERHAKLPEDARHDLAAHFRRGGTTPRLGVRPGCTSNWPTQSAGCAATPEVSRQGGAGILAQFRVTFDYPHQRLILEQRE